MKAAISADGTSATRHGNLEVAAFGTEPDID
jgi:hypothetical protein